MDVKQQFIKMKQENKQVVVPAKILSALVIYRVTEKITGPFDQFVLLNLEKSKFFKQKKTTNEERDAFVLKVAIILGQCVVEALNGTWSMQTGNIFEAQVVIDLPQQVVHYDPFEDAAKFITDPKRFPLKIAFRNLIKQIKENQ
ncbi:hypothetical protein [Polluticoccus soli]|uniref:hypothetical protein n=1 Tax=Polluticoccus soli TaxID=3034150 RepID=UPI0023E113F7|nr:hypothetical protein [Flavipsychrobacter sp. JY13-12]